jgi:hypothetical protein
MAMRIANVAIRTPAHPLSFIGHLLGSRDVSYPADVEAMRFRPVRSVARTCESMKASHDGYRRRMDLGRSRASRAARVLRTVLLVVLVVLAGTVLEGCTTGRPSSTSAWQSASDRALGEAISGLGTARVVVDQERRNRVPHTYAVEAVTDTIETSGREISSYQIQQPPDALHRANAAVGDALDEASSLLVEIRVTLASPGLTKASSQRLLEEIDTLRDELDQLDTAVMKSPESVGTQ